MKTALDATYSVLNTTDALVIQWRMDIIAHNAFSKVKVFRSDNYLFVVIFIVFFNARCSAAGILSWTFIIGIKNKNSNRTNGNDIEFL